MAITSCGDESTSGDSERLCLAIIEQARRRSERNVERAHDAIVNGHRHQEGHRFVVGDVSGNKGHALAGGAGVWAGKS